MSVGKMRMQELTAPLVAAVANLVGETNPATSKPYTVAEAEVVVCQITMDLYAWLLKAVEDSSPWPDPSAPKPPAGGPLPTPASAVPAASFTPKAISP